MTAIGGLGRAPPEYLAMTVRVCFSKDFASPGFDNPIIFVQLH